nr:hypothetical protein [Tanacetum cinerariifolium]
MQNILKNSGKMEGHGNGLNYIPGGGAACRTHD